jgi:hypothetical protein
MRTGLWALSARAVDGAGNSSALSAALMLTILDAFTGDFNGVGGSNPTVFSPATAQWFSQSLQTGVVTSGTYGLPNLQDIPVPGDYLGLGYDQMAIFRPSTAQWFLVGSQGLQLLGMFGDKNMIDIPVPGDYLDLGYTQLAVYRPTTGQWFVNTPTGGRLMGTFGAINGYDIPVPGDYLGLGYTQMALFRPATDQWFAIGRSGGVYLGVFGDKNLIDLPAPGDYLKLGYTQMAVFRPSTGQWFISSPTGGRLLEVYGATGLSQLPDLGSPGLLAWYVSRQILTLPNRGTTSAVVDALQTASPTVTFQIAPTVPLSELESTNWVNPKAEPSPPAATSTAKPATVSRPVIKARHTFSFPRLYVRPPQRIEELEYRPELLKRMARWSSSSLNV